MASPPSMVQLSRPSLHSASVSATSLPRAEGSSPEPPLPDSRQSSVATAPRLMSEGDLSGFLLNVGDEPTDEHHDSISALGSPLPLLSPSPFLPSPQFQVTLQQSTPTAACQEVSIEISSIDIIDVMPYEKDAPPPFDPSVDKNPHVAIKMYEDSPLLSPNLQPSASGLSPCPSGLSDSPPSYLSSSQTSQPLLPTTNEPASIGAPDYYPPRPRGPLTIFFSIILFPFYFIFYSFPIWFYNTVLVSVAQALLSCLLLIGTGIVNYIFKPISWVLTTIISGIGWVITTTAKTIYKYILLPISYACHWIYTKILTPVGTGISFLFTSIYTALKTAILFLLYGIYKTLAFISQSIYTYILLPLATLLKYISTTLYNILKYIAQAIYKAVSFILTSIYTIVKTISIFIWEWIIKPISLGILFIIKGIGMTILWIGVSIYTYILTPIGKAISWIVQSTFTYILVPIAKAVVFILAGIWKGIVLVFKGVGYVLGKIWDGCAWIASTLYIYVVTPVWKFVSMVVMGILNGVWVACKTIWTYILAPIVSGVKWIAATLWKGCTWIGREVWAGITFVGGVIKAGLIAVQGFLDAFVVQPVKETARAAAVLVREVGDFFKHLW